jgi:hypothetical protein
VPQHTRNDSITPGLRPPADNSNRPSGASAIDRITAIILQPRTGAADDTVLWPALQVMMTDDVALADDALQDRLIIVQDRIENVMRARLGLPDRDAPREQAVSEATHGTEL